MMEVYYMRVSWLNGIALFAAFLITFWPTRNRMIVAAVLWTIGTISLSGPEVYDLFSRDGMAHASSPSGSSTLLGWLIPFVNVALAMVEGVLAWLIPLVSLSFAIVAGVYLFPWIAHERAMRAGKILFLLVVPLFLLIGWWNSMDGLQNFPLGVSWLTYPLLWFRIRENVNERKGPNRVPETG